MVSGSRIILITDEGSNFKFGMATLLGKLYGTFDFEAAILDILVTDVTKVICYFQNLVLNWAKTTKPNLMKLGGNTSWKCVSNWLDFEPCDQNFKITRGQKVTNQNLSCIHATAQTSFPILMKLNGMMHWWSLMPWLDFGVCDLISKVTGAK